MTNPFKRRISHSASLYWIVYALTLATLCLWYSTTTLNEEVSKQLSSKEPTIKTAYTQPNEQITSTSSHETNQEGYATKSLGSKSTTLRVTAFSSIECKTSWCKANAGKPRGNQVALNAKFGKVTKVFIPKFNKEYTVIGTTDNMTDLDIWFSDDQQSAKEFGIQYLEVVLTR